LTIDFLIDKPCQNLPIRSSEGVGFVLLQLSVFLKPLFWDSFFQTLRNTYTTFFFLNLPFPLSLTNPPITLFHPPTTPPSRLPISPSFRKIFFASEKPFSLPKRNPRTSRSFSFSPSPPPFTNCFSLFACCLLTIAGVADSFSPVPPLAFPTPPETHE